MNKGKKAYTLLRQWKMLQLVPARYPKSATTLRDELENEGFRVDLRTVQRDLRELSEVFPLVAIEGKPISWRWDKNAMSFDIPGMDSTGAMTLKMVEGFMSQLLPQSCLDSLSPHIARANAILNDINADKYSLWPEKVRIIPRTQPLLSPAIDEHVLVQIYEALFKDRRFNATYKRKGSDTWTDYSVNPLGIIVAEPTLYLVATLWDYTDIRLMAIHRFQSATITDVPVRQPEGFSLDRYIESGALGFAFTEGKYIQLEASISKEMAEHLQECPLSADQILNDQEEGDVLLKATVLDTQQLRWWLLGFGDAVEVTGPASLRREFAEISSNMAGYYEEA